MKGKTLILALSATGNLTLIKAACQYDDGAATVTSEYGGNFPYFFSGTTYSCDTYGIVPLFGSSSWAFTGVCDDDSDEWGFITEVDETGMLQIMLYQNYNLGIKCAGYSVGGGNLACIAMGEDWIEVWKVSKSSLGISDRIILEDVSGLDWDAEDAPDDSTDFNGHMSIHVANNIASVGYGVLTTNMQIAHFDVLGFTASDATRIV
jgi:hypothetical protein